LKNTDRTAQGGRRYTPPAFSPRKTGQAEQIGGRILADRTTVSPSFYEIDKLLKFFEKYLGLV
jgi:hypothetical protein